MRVQPSLWSSTKEADVAEPYVTPNQRARGHGRELITEAIRAARQRYATFTVLITSKTIDAPTGSTPRPGSAPRDGAVRSRLPTNEICSPGRVTHFAAHGRTASRNGRVAAGLVRMT